MSDHSGADLIAAERQRQIEVEGWTPEHDDEHATGELAGAAVSYASHPGPQSYVRVLDPTVEDGYRPVLTGVPVGWPWHPSWWKPSDDPVRNLVKAGALIAAEIDRLHRQEQPEETDR